MKHLIILIAAILMLSCITQGSQRKNMDNVWEECCYKGYVFIINNNVYERGITQLLDEDGIPIPCTEGDRWEK